MFNPQLIIKIMNINNLYLSKYLYVFFNNEVPVITCIIDTNTNIINDINSGKAKRLYCKLSIILPFNININDLVKPQAGQGIPVMLLNTHGKENWNTIIDDIPIINITINPFILLVN